MADSAIVLNTNTSSGVSVDTRTNTGGEHRQVVVIGEGAAVSDAIIPGDATNGLLVNPSDRAARDMGKIDIAAFDVALGAVTSVTNPVAVTFNSNSGTVPVSYSSGTFAVSFNSTAGAIPVTDNGGSLTIDGSVSITGAHAVTFNSALGSGVASTAMRVEVANDGTGRLSSVTSITNPVAVTFNSTSGTIPVSYGSGTFAVSFNSTAGAIPVTDNSGSLTVDAPVGTPVFATITPSTTGGWTPVAFSMGAASVVTVKASSGTFGGYYVYNPNSSVAYVQVFDISGTVTMGSSTPKLSLGIPATSAANMEVANGVNFANAIKVAATTTASGSTSPTTWLDCSFIYK